MQASTRDCFPIQFSNSFLPLSRAFLYNPNVETIESKTVTSFHPALTVQRVDYRHIFTNMCDKHRGAGYHIWLE